ncbi:MAG TPA: 50S ribosomal protein L15 [Candidatus Limnocylindrales bacterium]|nr:50S ribosomal protein L15 [Candidatus Limnocylindrales bacterium]
MKLHDLRPAPGSHTRKTRVGRGIAAGKGKTAGRGTKGQKARAGGSIPPWFEGGQTPLHMRIPKLRGFENRFKIHYEVVNVGAIAAAAERGAFESGDLPGAPKGKKAAPLTVNQDVLRAVGLVRTMTKPLKILGAGDLDVALFVVADAFTKSAREKIEAAGGSVSVLETPKAATRALGLDGDGSAEAPAATPVEATDAPETRAAGKPAGRARKTSAKAATEAPAEEAPDEEAAAEESAAEEAPTEEPAPASDASDADATAQDEPAATAADSETADEAGDEPAAERVTGEADATDDENA